MALRRIASVALCAAIAWGACGALVGCVSTGVGSEEGDDEPSLDKEVSSPGLNPDLANEELADGGGSSAPAAAEAVEVTDLRYKSAEAGGTVVIETSAPATFRTREVPKLNQVIVEIANARLPARFKRPYPAKEFHQDIAAINAYQDAGSSTARIVVQFRNAASAAVRQEGRQLFVVYAPPGGGGNLVDSSVEANLPGAYAVEGGRSAQALSGNGLDAISGNSTVFYGAPISLEARDTPVRDIINAIAEQSGVNIVLSDAVRDQRISLKLRQVPWDQALLLIMKAQKLGYVRQGSVLRVATLESLRLEADEAKKVLEAQRKAQPFKTKIVPISYAKVDDIKKALDPFLKSSKTDGLVTTDVRTSSVVITDIPENIDRMVAVIRALDTPPLQVMIEGKILEASEKFQRSFGINWGADGMPFAAGNYTISPTGPTFNNSPSATNNSFGLTIGTFDVLGNLNAIIGLGETQDLVHILSAPRVVTLSNETADIQQSILVPQPSQVAAGATTTTSTLPVIGVAYHAIKLELKVTPQITAESDVILDVDLSREFVATGSATASSNIESRQAHTKVLVKNGQTAVIGGVYQNDSLVTEAGLPWLKDIPLFGYLFKSVDKSKTKNELLLFLTPRILNAEKGLIKEEAL